MYDKSGATWKTMQGCYPEDEHDENMHFSTPPIHYSGSHWALTYQKKKQQEIDSRRWQMRNVPSPASFLQVRYAPVWVISLPHCGVCAGHKWPTGWKSEHIKRRVRRQPQCEPKKKKKKELLSSRLMIRLIIHVAHPWVTWHNMRNDECRSSSTVSAVAWI